MTPEPLRIDVRVLQPGRQADEIMEEILYMLGSEWDHIEDPPCVHRFVTPWSGPGKPDPHPRVAVKNFLDWIDPGRLQVRLT